MPEYDYLIIGGGMAADAAVRGIREIDARGTIGLLSSESDPPYDRPPLSKALWKGEPLEGIWRETAELDLEVHLESTATLLDPLARTVRDEAGAHYGYGKLLIATGGTPRRLRGRDDGVIYFRSLADYRRLRALTSEHRRVAVVGGGYMGAEIAAALKMNGHDVEMVFPEETLLSRLVPQSLGEHLNGYFEAQGVELHPSSSVLSVVAEENGYKLDLGAERLLVDVVVAGLGIIPNTDLAEAAGLGVSNGIEVDHLLRTSNHDIFAAGDVASIYDPVLERRVRAEHEDNANSTGMHAGKAMAGQLEAYRHLPLFYSDLFEVGFEGVGRADSTMRVVCDWTRPNEEGVIYYLSNKRVEGVLAWNSWGMMDAARELIESRRQVGDDEVPTLLVGA